MGTHAEKDSKAFGIAGGEVQVAESGRTDSQYIRNWSARTPEALEGALAEAKPAHCPGIEQVNLFTCERFVM